MTQNHKKEPLILDKMQKVQKTFNLKKQKQNRKIKTSNIDVLLTKIIKTFTRFFIDHLKKSFLN